MSRKAAKEAKEQKTVVKQKEEAVAKTPYKHVPTHAAVDALSGAPSTWKVDDRSKIREHHKRRSQMVISRTGSSLSNVSYMNAAAGPSSMPPLPRNSSYSSYNPTWFDRGGDVYYANEQKRQRPSRNHSYHDSGIGPSPLASNLQSEEVSPVVSSGNSTTSNSSDNLEIPVTQKSKHVSHRPQPIVYAEQDIFDRLHTSTTRKLGEAPLHDSPPIKAPVVKVVTQEVKPKKQRWSLLGKKNSAAIQV
ncbi:hypothetical protein V8E51_009098 [Hyaloscypha variabilis]|uniref:Uncharacterized protein n=1 Tax=Hyaloscypha variabilis (strain UAMH 11265 / GT02V1 / F) TaxID=1149755 RepID=A0A2J6S6W0_HYAVF|nr:hypothetical protein L207DRAFT_523892 [Hyaloscypha variabilis F]